MSRTFGAAFAAFILALSLAGVATSAGPNASALGLQAADLPGAKLTTQGSVKETGFVSGYARSFVYKVPYGRSGIVYVRSEALVATGAAPATAYVGQISRSLRAAATLKALAAGIARGAGVKVSAVSIGRVRRPEAGDAAVEIPVTVVIKGIRTYESILYMRFDRVVELIVSAGVHPIAAAESAAFAVAASSHVGAALTPSSNAPATVTGTALQGQTLTAGAGSWSGADATLAFQWQRCDATGANCADVAGATTSTYLVQPADAASTLKVNVTATNRFGSAVATSAVTAVVA
jgi:hypothetical protein